MQYVTRDGQHRYPVDQPIWRSPETGAPVNLTPGPGMNRRQIDAADWSVWRYAAAIPVERSAAVDLGEGWTPLISAAYGPGRVRLKMESMAPSGSFKDRGMAVLVAYLRAHGVSEVMLDSSGNAAAALACYAAAGGLGCRVLVPAYTSPAKVAQIRVYGAEVELVEGTREQVAAAALSLAESGVFYASHNWQPFFLEGTKTLAYELWEQYGFDLPDNIIIPVGYGSNLLGCHIGFEELLRQGEIDRLPRLFAAQPANVGALARAFAADADTPVVFEAQPTVAEGVAATKLVRTAECVDALRASGGGAVAVPEEAILPALHRLARCGAFVEPSCAVAAAGYEQLVADGTIDVADETVLVMTGNGLKSIDAVME